MKTNMTQLISALTKAEGKKKSVSIGNVRELLKELKTLCKDPKNLKTVLGYLTK